MSVMTAVEKRNTSPITTQKAVAAVDWSDASIKKNLGELRGIPTSGALVRYVAGCMKRERERIARIIESTDDPQEVARLLRDDSLDHEVFKLAGPTHQLPLA